MAFTSKTGLTESARKTIRVADERRVALSCVSKRAPFVLRPFAALYNPFSYGCSILCNHPADAEIKHVVKRAKDALASESKNDDADTSRATLNASEKRDECVDFVEEELFRRYTDTDSRPLTPAPTLASAVSRSSLKRRCLTPDHAPAPKQTLILDLRRSHSQETLFWHGHRTSDLSSGLGEPETTENCIPPIVSPLRLSKRCPNPRANSIERTSKNQVKALQSKNLPSKGDKNSKPKSVDEVDENNSEEVSENVECEEENISLLGGGEIRRRGRRRKGRSRLMSAALISTTQNDPETQIAGIDSESHNPSSRESLVANDELDTDAVTQLKQEKLDKKYKDSFLQPDLLEYLYREVDQIAIESEFDAKRRMVLLEAYRTREEKNYGREMQTVMKDLKSPSISLNKWLHIPRVFSRRNAIFSLPIDRRELEKLLPMQYVSQYIKVCDSKMLLYRTILEKFSDTSIHINIENITQALKVVMGEVLDEEMSMNFQTLLKWNELNDNEISNLVEKPLTFNNECKINDKAKKINVSEDSLFAEFDVKEIEKQDIVEYYKKIHFRTWCGLCGLCERLYAPLPSLAIDPPHEIEVADFDTIQGKLLTQKVDDQLAHILQSIQNSHF